jgi:hypothetical protein
MNSLILLALLGLNLWTLSRVIRLRKVVFALIQFNAGLVENMKKDQKFSRDSEEYALETIYGVWRKLTGERDRRQ